MPHAQASLQQKQQNRRKGPLPQSAAREPGLLVGWSEDQAWRNVHGLQLLEEQLAGVGHEHLGHARGVLCAGADCTAQRGIEVAHEPAVLTDMHLHAPGVRLRLQHACQLSAMYLDAIASIARAWQAHLELVRRDHETLQQQGGCPICNEAVTLHLPQAQAAVPGPALGRLPGQRHSGASRLHTFNSNLVQRDLVSELMVADRTPCHVMGA